VDVQHGFLEKGSICLKPLTMKQVADKIGMHETTVSRAVANKFAKTPQGVIALKYFFSAGFQSSDGDMISSRGVMEKIRNIIDEENKNSPCSDDDIAKILNEEGIPVARRTVAKYREELGILPSRMRKEID
ncbi:MAG: RNA polymerase sigma-54 factor, partial [Lentisphaerota bacterium]